MASKSARCNGETSLAAGDEGGEGRRDEGVKGEKKNNRRQQKVTKVLG